LRNKLTDIESKRKVAVPGNKQIKSRSYLNYAAVIGGALIIGSLTLFSGGELSTEKIMNEYYKPYEPATSQRAAVAGTDVDFSLALEFYNTRDYKKAAALFSKVLESKPGDMQIELLNGVSNFEEKKYPEAKQSFGKVIDDKNNLYIDQAQWYLALCYLNTKETEKAQQLLAIIEKEKGFYKKDARRILRGLK
jgi:TolA-binding protein